MFSEGIRQTSKATREPGTKSCLEFAYLGKIVEFSWYSFPVFLVCGYTYVHMCASVCVYTCAPVCAHVCMHACACVCACMCVPLCACIHVSPCVGMCHVHVCAPVCVCMCVPMCARMCVHACVPLHTHRDTRVNPSAVLASFLFLTHTHSAFLIEVHWLVYFY